MKFYFTSANNTSTNYSSLSNLIAAHLQKSGHTVYRISNSEDHFDSFSEHKIKAFYKEWSAYVSDCDCIIIEGSYPSNIHIGFEIGLLAARSKPVIFLYERGKDPIMINAHYSRRIIKSEYMRSTLSDTIDWCIEEATRTINKRFTFYIPPDIDTFLDKISQKRKMSRSEFIRMLIESEMSD